MLRPLLVALVGLLTFDSGILCANVARARLNCQGTPLIWSRLLSLATASRTEIFVLYAASMDLQLTLTSLKALCLAAGCLQIADALIGELDPPPSSPANEWVGGAGCVPF